MIQLPGCLLSGTILVHRNSNKRRLAFTYKSLFGKRTNEQIDTPDYASVLNAALLRTAARIPIIKEVKQYLGNPHCMHRNVSSGSNPESNEVETNKHAHCTTPIDYGNPQRRRGCRAIRTCA